MIVIVVFSSQIAARSPCGSRARAREMGIAPLGIYSQADDGRAYHLHFMDDARCIGPAPAAESYLNIDAVIAAAIDMKADAVHPGYGFLSERAAFAQACIDAGLIFVGPPPSAMAAMGSKIDAKHRVRKFDVPTVPGYDGDDQSLERLRKEAADGRLSAADQSQCRRRRTRHARRRVARRLRRSRSPRPSAKRSPRSATMPCCSNATCAIRATSNFKCSPMRTGRRFIWASANVRFSAAIKRSSKKRRRLRSRRNCAPRWARPRCAPQRRSAMSTPAPCEFMLDSDGNGTISSR